jgi:hypothetical protein
MIGSRCLVCDAEVQEFEKFYIVENGIVHSKCRVQPGAEGSDELAHTAARVCKQEQGYGRR